MSICLKWYIQSIIRIERRVLTGTRGFGTKAKSSELGSLTGLKVSKVSRHVSEENDQDRTVTIESVSSGPARR
jgi:hypothetical protein